jgi:integrase/recombinase XerD
VARKGQKKVWAFVEASDPRGMVALLKLYVESLRVRNLSEMTIAKIEWEVARFIVWCHERGVTRPQEVTKPVVDRYQRWLFYYRRSDNGKPLSFRSQYKLVGCVKYFFRFLTRENYALQNPAADLLLPKLGKHLPRQILTVSEAERVLALPDLSSPYGMRDRAILETLYSTGIRRSELVRLKLYDIGFEKGVVMIREGKGKKDRVVPIGERALFWIDKYLNEVRPQLVVPPDDGVLFLSYAGVGFHPDYLGHEVKRYVATSGIGKSGACHIFRHTMATLMLEGGADVRYVQEMLGHSKLTSTQIYTQVAIDKLKQIHTATHPGALLHPPRTIAEDVSPDPDDQDGVLLAPGGPGGDDEGGDDVG